MATAAPSSIDLDREYIRRKGLYGFARIAWHIVEPGIRFLPNWHLEEIAIHLEAVSRGEITRLVINVPPATGKSLFVDVFWPAWDWIHNPGRAWINAAYDPDLTTRDADKVMAIVRSDWYVERWGTRLPPEPERLASRSYSTLQGGSRFSTSVGGKGIGRHADIQSINDPTKPVDVMGESGPIVTKALQTASNWYRNTMASRLRDPAHSARVITMQRLHQSDLAGEAIDSGDYVALVFPMRYDATDPCKTLWGGDRRTVGGQLLWPERYPEKVVAHIEKEMGAYVRAAQFQQRPASRGGQIFKTSDLRFYTDIIAIKYADEFLLSGDLSFKDTDGSDFVCLGAWARKGENFYLCPGFINERLAFVETTRAFARLARKWPNAYRKVIENKANGPAVENMLASGPPITLEEGALARLDGIELVEPKGGKVARAHAVQPLFEAGRVWFPSAELDPNIVAMVDPKKGQLVNFPRAAHDDFVDMVTQALLCLWDGGGESFSAAMQELARSGTLFNR